MNSLKWHITVHVRGADFSCVVSTLVFHFFPSPIGSNNSTYLGGNRGGWGAEHG